MMEAYFDTKVEGRFSGLLVTLVMLVLGIAAFVVAEQIITGWMPLGERANILRSNLNFVEWLVIIISGIYGLAALRTAWGLYRRERASLRWSQWVSFITIFIGLGIIFSVVIPTALKFMNLLSERINPGQVLENIGGIAPAMFDIGIWLAGVGLAGLLLLALVILLGFLLPGLEVIRRTPGLQWLAVPPRQLVYLLVAFFALGVVMLIMVMGFIVNEFPFAVSKIRHPEFERLISGSILFILGMATYYFVRQSEEESDELRRAVGLTPGKAIRFLLRKSPSAGAIIGFIAIFFGFTMATDLFLAQTSVASFLTNISIQGIIAIGVTYLMISGEFDLSVGSILGVTAMVFLQSMTPEGVLGTGITVSPFVAALIALFVAFILGAINGVLLIRTGIPSFIVTLGTLLMYRGITLVVIAGGRILRYRDYYPDFPQTFISPWVFIIAATIGLLVVLYIGYRAIPVLWRRFSHSYAIRANNGDFGTTTAIINGVFLALVVLALCLVAVWLVFVITFHLENPNELVQVGFFDLTNGRWAFTGSDVTRGLINIQIDRNANFRMSIIWWVIFVVFFHIILTRTAYGNSVYATGGNPGAARAQGVNVDRVKVQNFVLVALLTGIAAVYEVARNPGVDPLKGEGFEFDAIAITVVGGALLSGGYGSVIGSLLGALIFGMLQTGLVLVGIDARLLKSVVGLIIISAVVLNTAVRGRRE